MAQQSNESMRLRVDVNNMFDDFVGEGNGITSDDITALVPRLTAAHEAIQNARGTGMMGWMNMPYEQDAIVADILDAAREIRENFDAFVKWHLAFAEKRELLGGSNHLLYICQKTKR